MPTAWTQEEDNALLAAIPSDSLAVWDVVAAALSGRSTSAVKNRFSAYLQATPMGQAKKEAKKEASRKHHAEVLKADREKKEAAKEAKKAAAKEAAAAKKAAAKVVAAAKKEAAAAKKVAAEAAVNAAQEAYRAAPCADTAQALLEARVLKMRVQLGPNRVRPSLEKDISDTLPLKEHGCVEAQVCELGAHAHGCDR
jgi:hypothetical protein